MTASGRTTMQGGFTVKAVQNDDHYADRRPGPMHPDDEARVSPC